MNKWMRKVWHRLTTREASVFDLTAAYNRGVDDGYERAYVEVWDAVKMGTSIYVPAPRKHPAEGYMLVPGAHSPGTHHLASTMPPFGMFHDN